MNNPLVSIIIPSYNRAHIIHETLDSIAEQTYENWECIIVDDGSTDDTILVVAEYIKKDSRFQFYNRPESRIKGANACRNFGFEISKGEYVMFLDSDDICEPFCLTERVGKMVNDLSIDLLIRDTALLIGTKKQTISINKDPLDFNTESYLRMFLTYELPWPIMGVFYKRGILTGCKFDENLNRFQDVSLNIKVLSRVKNLKIGRDYKIDTYYRDDSEKVFRNNFIENMFEALYVFDEIHTELFKNIQYKRDFTKFISKIILRFVTIYFYQNKKTSNKLLLWAMKSDAYTFSQKRTLLLLMFCLNTGLFKLKGIGMYKVRDKLKKMTKN